MILKYLIPFDRFVIDSPLSSVEARARIQAAMEPKKLVRFGGGTDGALEGVMTVHGFRMNKVPKGRNSTMAIVIAEIDPAPGGSRITGHIRMPVFTTAFISVWLSLWLTAGFGGFVNLSSLFDARAVDVDNLFPVGIALFAYGFIMWSFWSSADELTLRLRGIFEARTASGYSPTVR